jgi:Fe2+ or Zn2+ uptake regulation protein
MRPNVAELLSARGIQPSAQRVAVAQYILFTEEHPSADRVWARVRSRFPMISRATVYNTLNLFVSKGLVREVHLSPNSVVFDANTEAHHHFIDEETGRIYDIPWEKVAMRRLPTVDGFEIQDYEVVMRGRKTPSDGRRRLRRGAMTSPRGTNPQKKMLREEENRAR